jgi:hypothetical protein
VYKRVLKVGKKQKYTLSEAQREEKNKLKAFMKAELVERGLLAEFFFLLKAEIDQTF